MYHASSPPSRSARHGRTGLTVLYSLFSRTHRFHNLDNQFNPIQMHWPPSPSPKPVRISSHQPPPTYPTITNSTPMNMAPMPMSMPMSLPLPRHPNPQVQKAINIIHPLRLQHIHQLHLLLLAQTAIPEADKRVVILAAAAAAADGRGRQARSEAGRRRKPASSSSFVVRPAQVPVCLGVAAGLVEPVARAGVGALVVLHPGSVEGVRRAVPEGGVAHAVREGVGRDELREGVVPLCCGGGWRRSLLRSWLWVGVRRGWRGDKGWRWWRSRLLLVLLLEVRSGEQC